jgi:hypothetical protein
MTTRTILLSAVLFFATGFVSIAQTGDSSTRNISVPFRFGIFPGLSTQGKADAYTTSNFSLNLWGGYTGSVDGIELGSLFNMNRGDVQFVQAAGLFNTVGGNVRGVQAAGIFNMARKNVSAVQSAGIYNHAGKNFSGLQAAGIANFTGGVMRGVQSAGIVNYAKHVKGIQIGLINIADTSEGFHIGLINIVKKGYHKLFVSANEVMNANIAIKTGNPKLYNILLAGVNPGSDNKVFSYGYGLGREIKLGKALTLNPEISSQYLYLGSWDHSNWLSKVQVLVNVQLTKGVALTGGPSFNVYYSNQNAAIKGYKFNIPSYSNFELWDDNVTGWIGWNAGLTFF